MCVEVRFDNTLFLLIFPLTLSCKNVTVFKILPEQEKIGHVFKKIL